jgi:hypothetical protein
MLKFLIIYFLELEIFKNDSFNVVYHDIKKTFLILNKVRHEKKRIEIVQA